MIIKWLYWNRVPRRARSAYVVRGEFQGNLIGSRANSCLAPGDYFVEATGSYFGHLNENRQWELMY